MDKLTYYTKDDAWADILKFYDLCRIVAGLDINVIAKKVRRFPFLQRMGTVFESYYKYVINNNDNNFARYVYGAVYMTTYPNSQSFSNLYERFEEISLLIVNEYPTLAEEIQKGADYIREVCRWYLLNDGKVGFTNIEHYLDGTKKYGREISSTNVLMQPQGRAVMSRGVGSLLNEDFTPMKNAPAHALKYFAILVKHELSLRYFWKYFEEIWPRDYKHDKFNYNYDYTEIESQFSTDAINKARKNLEGK